MESDPGSHRVGVDEPIKLQESEPALSEHDALRVVALLEAIGEVHPDL
jgi:hypothetical protein